MLTPFYSLLTVALDKGLDQKRSIILFGKTFRNTFSTSPYYFTHQIPVLSFHALVESSGVGRAMGQKRDLGPCPSSTITECVAVWFLL